MVQYTWNGWAWTSQGEVRYLYDGMLMVQERNSSNTPQVHYSRGLDLSGTIHGAGGIGGLLMRSHGYSAGNWSTHNAYHSDANGNVTALVNSSGVLQASYKYNPYGGLISWSGPLSTANTMRFSSKPAILSATGSWGFYYYGYRFYDAVNQRWLNRDPIEEAGGRNFYGFVGNGPSHRADPLGLYWFEWGDSWPNYLGPEPNAKPRVGPPPPPPADPDEDLNLLRCSYGGMQIGEEAAHEAAGLVGDVGREVFVGTAGVAVGGLIGALPWVRGCPQAAKGLGNQNALFKNALQRLNEREKISKVGRALTKHPEVVGATKATLRHSLRSDTALNEAANEALKRIMRYGITTTPTLPRYGTVVQKKIPFGFGARWYPNGDFIGFINP
jgi:RHS repeat-associated protein